MDEVTEQDEQTEQPEPVEVLPEVKCSGGLTLPPIGVRFD